MDKIDMCMSHEASLKEDIYCLFFSIISAGHCCILLAIFVIVSYFKPIKKPVNSL
jgi:hypothetical protein